MPLLTLALCLSACYWGKAKEAAPPPENKGLSVPGSGHERVEAKRAYPIPGQWLLPPGQWVGRGEQLVLAPGLWYLVPVPWFLVPVPLVLAPEPWYEQTFRGELVDGEGQEYAAMWRVEGPQNRECQQKLSRINARVLTSYRVVIQKPGDYVVSCTFVGIKGEHCSVAWSLKAATDPYSPSGRKVGPSEPGTMVFIRGGDFPMGAPRGEDSWYAPPAHRVGIDDFFIGRYPVTAGEFCEFLNERGNLDHRYLYEDEKIRDYLVTRYPGQDYLLAMEQRSSIFRDPSSGRYAPLGDLQHVPANQVTFFGAVAYCKWLSERTGRSYRLPTEAEWEYAARGPEGRKFPWGRGDPAKQRGAEARLEEYGLSPIGFWTNVGSFPANSTPDGVADMAGPDMQWCSDPYPEDRGWSASYAYVPWPWKALWHDPETAPRVVRGLGYHSKITSSSLLQPGRILHGRRMGGGRSTDTGTSSSGS